MDDTSETLPQPTRRMEAELVQLRLSGRVVEVVARLRGLLSQHPTVAWIPARLAEAIESRNRLEAIQLYERALSLDPGNIQYRLALVQALAMRMGADEGVFLDRALAALKPAMARVPEFSEADLEIADRTLTLACDHDGRTLLHLAWLAGRARAARTAR